MYLRGIKLRNWKAYGGEAKFEFPTPTKRKNLVLIGAPNGYGKTSVLEALLFGLYGRDAMPIVNRAKVFESEAEKGYGTFLQRALYARAIEDGQSSMTVELEFEDPDSESGFLTVQRIWYFKTDGSFREEQTNIFTGHERRPLKAPKLEEDKEDFFRGRIAQECLSPHLAQFFLFDGEQVQRLAQQDMAQQVRIGIEGMLGATVLRELATDLESYARDRRKQVKDVSSDSVMNSVQIELEKLQEQLQVLESEHGQLQESLPQLAQRRDELSTRLQSFHGGQLANAKELQRNKDIAEAEVARLREQLASLLTGDLALALAGPQLRSRLESRLRLERNLEAWEGGIRTSDRQRKRFEEEFAKQPPAFEPPLTEAQSTALAERICAAWREMWHPPPEGCAPFYRHSYLSDSDRQAVGDRLQAIRGLGQSGLEDLLHRITESERDYERYDQQLRTFETVGPALEVLTKDLEAVLKAYAEGSARKGAVEREATAVRSQVQQKKAEYERLSAKHAKAQPALVRISAAEKIASMLPGFIKEATAAWVSRIASYMTEAYREIAHKDTVQRVEIDSDCRVRLLTKSGQDIRSLDASAGEDQIFSFALISAIARATETKFPIVIDTPLARLDEEHRLRILEHFTNRAGEQIILLSTNTEVVGKYHAAVQARVAKTFMLEHSQIGGGFGLNRVLPGRYFEEGAQ